MTDQAIAGAAHHGLSPLLLLVVVLPLARLGIRSRLQRHSEGSRRQWRTALRIRFAVAGLFLGGTWVWHASSPLWERLVRLAVVMLLVVPAVRWVARRSRGQTAPAKRSTWNWYWFAMKLTLLVFGSLAQLGLEAVTSRSTASWIVGAALAVTVALAGPELTTWALRRRLRRSQQVD
ncbi:MAG TPA: hypothetical protein VHD58_02810 [Mycobacteriales bacterium]|nr:hypothetical protein [Mycobacteriales bacterium]